MTRTVQIPDLTEQLAEIVADPTAYVRRTRELANQARWTRLRDYDGTPYRCPTCHPLALEAS